METKSSVMRGDRRVKPEQITYRLLSFDECKTLRGNSRTPILDLQGKIATVLITSVKTWKTRADEIEVHYKFGLYEYGTLRIVRDVADNDVLIAIVESAS